MMNIPHQSSSSDTCDVDVVLFDVDGTLVSHPDGKVVWELFNRRFVGNDDINHTRLAEFRSGRLSYAQWVELDVLGWKQAGVTKADMEQVVREELRPTPGAQEVLSGLKHRGYRLGVVSGTIDLVLDLLFPEHPFEWVFANRLRFDEEGRIVGWEATPYDMKGKAEAIARLAREQDLDLHRFAFVGDHVNDCEAMRSVSCSVAYDPKDESVRKAARFVVPRGAFREILHLFP